MNPSHPRTLYLKAFLMATGHHGAGWRHPQAQADGGLDLAHYQRLVRLAERSGFDAIFLSDPLAMLPGRLDARGHLVLAGTGADIADVLEHWLLHAAADGFKVMPPYLPGGLKAFAGHVLPELRRRGLLGAARRRPHPARAAGPARTCHEESAR